MTSYSKVFKGTQVSTLEGVKIISQPPLQVKKNVDSGKNDGSDGAESDESNETVQVLLAEAEARAQEMLDSAEDNARRIEEEATAKINQWWEENQAKLEAMSTAAEQQGYQEGFTTGKLEAEIKVQQEYQSKIDQVQQIIQQAYEQKEEIISEAEPFLLELSTVIAEQIIKQELKSDPEKFLELIKQHILRFKEKEFITVCVHPNDYDFIHSQRSHLSAVVNGETEITIIPDHSVSPSGCIIRTAYGSVDARIDTQIEEIKKVILESRREPEDGIIS